VGGDGQSVRTGPDDDGSGGVRRVHCDPCSVVEGGTAGRPARDPARPLRAQRVRSSTDLIGCRSAREPAERPIFRSRTS
jgi:hypothetical protein